MPAKKKKTRAPLSRERVLQTAVEVADAGGLEELSMRNIGHRLGVEAMSLYNHVTGKDDILDAMADFVVGKIELPAPGEPWKEACCGTPGRCA
jgi:AcrR family transcriptional regulator